MVCIQIRTDVLLVLNWVQTICKCYQLKNLGNNEYKSGKIQMKDERSSPDDVKYKNNINLKKESRELYIKWFRPSFDPGMLDL